MPAGQPYGVYDQFAWCYRKGWGEDYHRAVRPVLERDVFPRLQPGARVLDLCCGSGDLSATLAERGYRVTGIDGSQEMLRFARERVPCAEFRLEDARLFESPPVFASALSTFDSLNHILRLEELELVFANVRRALLPGGLFTFDLNMQECFETLWRGSSATVGEDEVSITRGSFDAEQKIGRADITLFRRQEGDRWGRSDVVVLEKCYPAEEILCALQQAGFTGVVACEAYQLGMRGDIALGRSFFFAETP